MFKRYRILFAAVLGIAAGQLAVSAARPVFAELDCTSLMNGGLKCGGGGFCGNRGQQSACTITCDDGTQVNCTTLLE